MPDDTVNERIRDRLIRHSVYLERYKSGVVQRMLAALAESEQALRRDLTERLERIDALGRDTGPATTARLEQIIRELETLRAEQLGALPESMPPQVADEAVPVAQAPKTIGATMGDEIAKLGAYEAGWMISMLIVEMPQAVVAVLDLTRPTSAQVYAATMSRPFQGALLREAYQQFKAADQRRLRQTIREGYLSGRTTPQIVRDLLGSRSHRGRDGALFQSRRNAEAMARTALQHTASAARREVGRQNADVIKAWKHVSTLDSRTCLVAGTLIDTPDGPRPIEQLSAGDLVTGGSGQARRITGTSRKQTGRLVRVTLSNGAQIVCTRDHPWLTEDGRWIDASDLIEGQRLGMPGDV